MVGVRPCLVFSDNGEEAIRFYVSLFKNSKIQSLQTSEGGVIPKGHLMHASFELDGQEYTAFDGGSHFQFSEAFSMMVTCADQDEVDGYWERLLAGGGEPGPCGWLKDRFGVSWQVVPRQLGHMLGNPSGGNIEAMTRAMFGMHKLDIAELEAAYRGVAAL